MLVNNISSINLESARILRKNDAPQWQSSAHQPLAMPTYAHYAHLNVSPLSFSGGNSIDLAKSIEMLEEYERNHKEAIFPTGVREAAKETIEKGNPYNLTLIDIHKQVYEDVNNVTSLDELMFYYPEFSSVQSVDDVEYQKGSFIDRVKNGELEHFNPENETSLDLVRLFYAEGFSTNDLKEYTGGKSIYHTTKKLNVPLLHPHYAHILKLSDKDYNERLVSAMLATKKDNLERKLQSGEPVFIPKRQMSQEEVAHVNKDLDGHFEQSPNEIYFQTQNQKRFYEEHPELKDRFSTLVLKTWDMSRSMKKEVEKHFSKTAGRKIQIKDLDPFVITAQDTETLKDFWNKNPWAVKKFAENMKIARGDMKAQEENSQNNKYRIFKTVPQGFVQDFEKWKRANGINQKTVINPVLLENGQLDNEAEVMRTHKNITRYCDDNLDFQNTMADVYSLTLIDLYQHIMEDKAPHTNVDDLVAIAVVLEIVKKEIIEVSFKERYDEDLHRMRQYIKTEEAGVAYQKVLRCLIETKQEAYLDMLYEGLDANYEKYKKQPGVK